MTLTAKYETDFWRWAHTKLKPIFEKYIQIIDKLHLWPGMRNISFQEELLQNN